MPRHNWDWYQLVPVPVRIIANQERWLADCEANDPFVNLWIEYYEATHGFFGPYENYDEHMWAFEGAMEIAERYFDTFLEEEYEQEKPILQSIDQILNSASSNLSLAGRAVMVVDRYIHSDASIQKFSAWITENFKGSHRVMVGAEDGGIDGGLVMFDDGSHLMFHRTPDGILLAEWVIRGKSLPELRHRSLLSQIEGPSAKLSMRQFEEIARYFAYNFGLQAPSNAR